MNYFLKFCIGLILPFFFYSNNIVENHSKTENKSDTINISENVIKPIIPTFLGNWQRNYYGNKAPEKLNIKWKLYLGKGETVISRKKGSRIWAGAGWTGQALIVKENNEFFLIQGAYDHNLKKINASNGKLVWQYKFDDVIKGTGTLWIDNTDKNKTDLVILQGSRLGTNHFLDAKHIPSYRAISYNTGKELWRLDVKWTHSYSRDVDASALILKDTAYIGLENSLFTVFNPDYRKASLIDNMLQPEIFQELKLYTLDDVRKHKNNIVTESSPSLLNNHIYVASGSGHVFGYNLKTKKLDWNFYIGSDMDGSAVVTSDSCLMISVEKQYIKGKGGAFKLNPAYKNKEAVEWFFPVENTNFAGWEGGIIGSIAINDNYIDANDDKLAAFTAIDGYLYVVKHQVQKDGAFALGPDSTTYYPVPELVFKMKVGPSISTPIFVNNKLIVAGYWGIYLFQYDKKNNFTLIDKKPGSYESTPIVNDGKIFVASRNGYLYCYGN